MLEQAPRPQTKKQSCRVLGLVGYYSRFVPNLATVISPLTDYLQGGQPNVLRWDEAGIKALETLRY